MKKLVLLLFPLLALALLFFVYQKMHELPTEVLNHKKEPLEVKDNTVQCPVCFMYIVGKDYTAQAVSEDKKTHFFDDVGCLVLWVEEYAKDKDVVQWVYTLDTKRWIDATKAYYSVDDMKTPMEYGFGAYEKRQEGFIGFEEMRLRMLRGETLLNPKIRKKILGE